MQNLRVAVIGCGRMGRERALAAEKAGAHVVFVCDINSEMAGSLAEQLSDCQAGDKVSDLDYKAIDAVFICTPPIGRGPIELAAIENGVAFFIEKPIALSADHCQEVAQALEKKPTISSVGYMNRYRQSVQRVREKAGGKRILAASSDWLVGMYKVPWWADEDSSGGPLNEQATHLIDLARFLVGEIVSVQGIAERAAANPDIVGRASFNLKFANGSLFSLLYSCEASVKMVRFSVYTEEESMNLEGWDFRLAGEEFADATPDTPRNAIFQTETEAFLEAVAGKNTDLILSDFFDALKTQRVVDTIRRSIRTGNIESIEN